MAASMTPIAATKRSPLRGQIGLSWIVALGIFVVVVRYCSSLRHMPVFSTLDYPIKIISVQRILRGEAPFRDFQTLYGPLGYYLAAFFQWPFHSHSPVFTYNYYVFASLILTYGIICACFSRLRPRRFILFIGVAIAIVQSAKPLLPLAFYSVSDLLPVLLASFTVQLTVESPGRNARRTLLWQWITGTLIAAEIFIRINYGFYLAMAVIITGVGAFLVGNRGVATAAARCVGAAFAMTCLLFGVFAVMGISRPLIADLPLYISRDPAGRAVLWKDLPLKPLAIVTAISVGATTLRSLGRLYRRQIDFWLVPYILLLGFFSYTFLRFDALHLLPVLILSMILLCENPTEQWDSPSDLKPSNRPISRFFGLPELQLIAFFMLLHLLYPIPVITSIHRHIAPGLKRTVEPSEYSVPESTTILRNVELYAKEADMVHHLDSLRKPDEEVFWMSAPQACQSTFDMCANVALYLADGILPKQNIWYFDTVTTPYEDIQQRIIAGLEANKTHWIGVQDVFVPGTVGVLKSQSNLLNDYVLSHYTIVFDSDIPNRNLRFKIYARKS